jgi:hypothetical protein
VKADPNGRIRIYPLHFIGHRRRGYLGVVPYDIAGPWFEIRFRRSRMFGQTLS